MTTVARTQTLNELGKCTEQERGEGVIQGSHRRVLVGLIHRDDPEDRSIAVPERNWAVYRQFNIDKSR